MDKSRVEYYLVELLKSIVPVLIGFFLGFGTFSREFNANEKARLNQGLDKILDLNMQYPFLNDSLFIVRWKNHKDSNSDSAIRYQTYCTFIFNYLQDVCQYYNYNKEKIAQYLDVSDLVNQHKQWWIETIQEDAAAYPDNFRNFIKNYFDK